MIRPHCPFHFPQGKVECSIIRMKARNTIRLLLLSLLLGAPAALTEAAGWWRGAWEYRAGVTFPPQRREQAQPTGLAGDDVGVATFHHGGHIAADGRDVRVVTSRGQVVPHRILMMTGPGDRCRVAFALRPDVPTYYVYFGNPKSEPSDPPLDIRRGVLIEMWPYLGGPANNPAETQKTLERSQSKPALGAGFADDIFQGCNPFGPRQNIAGRYTAWIVAPQAGEYQFATSSMNASFLWVDDALVVPNGGWHGPQYQIIRRGSVTLTAGLHKLTFLHISPWGDPIAVVVWQPPGRQWSRLDAKAFTPVRAGQAGPVEKRGQAINIDFLVQPGGETFCRNRYYQRREFVARIQGRGGHGVKWRWEFGDGLSGEGENVQHVYLLPGVYTIRLTAQGLTRPMEISHRVEVDRPWDRLAVNRLERLRDYADEVTSYDLAKLTPPANAEAVMLFQRAQDAEHLHKACEVFLQRGNADANSIEAVLTICVETLLATGKSDDARTAADALQKAATMTDKFETAVDMRLRAADVLIENAQAPDEVMTLIQRVLDDPSTKNAPALLRRAKITLGDAWRAKGDREKALAAYNQAGVVEPRAKEHSAVARGDFARQAEAYLNTRDHAAARDALDAWEQTFPADRLEGYTTLLRVELLLAEKNCPAAVRQAEAFVKVSPQSPHAPEILMQAYLAYRAAGRTEQARQTLQRLADNYRESPLSRKAKQLLK